MKPLSRFDLVVALARSARSGLASPGKATMLVLCLLAMIPALGQELSATFRPQKSVYLLGEPVWFIFEVKNQGSLSIYIEHAARPFGYDALMDGYSFDVPGAVDHTPCGCINCGGTTSKLLAPGGTYTQRLLLDQWFTIDHPGRYRVSASRQLRFSGRIDSLRNLIAPRSRSFKSEFEIDVVEGEKADVEKAFEPVLRDLNGGDFERREEAVETLSAMANPLLQSTLIALANGQYSFEYSSPDGRAIQALGRLNTPESKRVLAKLVEDGNEYYSWEAIDALVATGDRTYVPPLMEVASDPKWQNVALPALAELGGDDVVPYLAGLARYSLGAPREPSTQSVAIQGLGNTSSREAIPYLIEALRKPTLNQDAVNALSVLTGLTILDKEGGSVIYAPDQATATKMADRWQRWWKSAGATAELYGPRECGNHLRQLPGP